MIFKNKRFKYMISFVVILCSLCAIFAVSASAQHYTANDMYGEDDHGYTYVCDFNPLSEDKNGNYVNDVADGWLYSSNILSAFYNCNVQLVYYNDVWCLSVAPLDYDDEVNLTFNFENCILERGRKYCSVSLGFGQVFDPDQRIDWYLSCSYSNLETTENKNSVGSGCFPTVGQNFLDFKLDNGSYRCQVGSVDLSFSEIPVGNVIYIYSFGFGSDVENHHNYDNMLKVHDYDDIGLGVFIPFGTNVDDISVDGFCKVFDFTSDSLNLTELFREVLSLYNEYVLDVGSYPHIYLFFPDYNLRDCLAIGTSRSKSYWDDFEYLASPAIVGIKPDNTLTFPGHYQLAVDENGDYIYNSPVRSFGNFYTRFVDICMPMQEFEEMYDEDVVYTLYRYSSAHDYLWWLEDFTESESYDDGYDFGYGKGLENGYNNGYLEGWDGGYDTGKTDGFAEGQEHGLDVGYDNGYREGTSDGYDDGYDDGYQKGTSDGYKTGYDTGVNESASVWEDKVDEAFSKGYADGYNIGFANGDGYEGQNFNDLIITTAQSVGSVVVSMFNWELFGINLMALLGGFMFLGVALFIIKFVK